MAKTFFDEEVEQAKEYAKKAKKVYKNACVKFTESHMNSEKNKAEFRKIVDDLIAESEAKKEEKTDDSSSDSDSGSDDFNDVEQLKMPGQSPGDEVDFERSKQLRG